MAATGKLEKMLILAFDTAEDAERGATRGQGALRGADQPETYTLEYKVKTADGQGRAPAGRRSSSSTRSPRS